MDIRLKYNYTFCEMLHDILISLSDKFLVLRLEEMKSSLVKHGLTYNGVDRKRKLEAVCIQHYVLKVWQRWR